MTTFYHPYQFVPSTGKINNKSSAKTSYDKIKSGESIVRHDVWLPDSLSGEVVCSLRTVSPMFVGAQNDNEISEYVAKVIPNFTLPFADKEYPAIPANSLRGMISQCMEVLSQSTLRVLEDKILSVRKQMPKTGAGQENNELLYGFGLIREIPAVESNESGFGILPLAVGTQLEMGDGRGGGQGVSCNKELPWMELFKGRSLSHCLPAYIDGYNERNGRTDFLYSLDPSAYPYPSEDTFYYAKLHDCLSHVKVGDKFEWTHKMRMSVDYIGNCLLAQKQTNLITEIVFRDLPSEEKRLYTRGVVRVLDMDKYKSEIPRTKNRELFLPFPEYLDDEDSILPISKAVVETFDALIAESKVRGKDKDLPVRLKGYDSAKLKQNRIFCFMCNSQIVKSEESAGLQEEKQEPVFDLRSALRKSIEKYDSGELDDHEPEEERVYIVSEVSLTTLWRKRIPETLYSFFNNNTDDAHLTPWKDEDQQECARRLTPAETLLGFVSDGTFESSKVASALASRVRFSDGTVVSPDENTEYYVNETTLKILASPKLPSPSMYFSDREFQGKYVSKTALEPEKHKPNGFKFFLHHPKACLPESKHIPWKTGSENLHMKQKVRVKPIRQEVDFNFIVSFENLSAAELELLLVGLKPSEDSHHKLGMGKPLGLGSVKVDIAGVYFINRTDRYQFNSLFAPRYHKAWINSEHSDVHDVINAEPLDKTAEVEALANGMNTLKNSIKETLIDQVTHKTLCRLMDVNAVPLSSDVHYPLVEGQKQEGEGYKWFVVNDKAAEQKKQILGSVMNSEVSTLKRHPDYR